MSAVTKMRPSPINSAVSGVLLTLALAAAAILLPVDRRLLMEIALVFAMAQGWNLLCGYTGLMSFGHQGFVGVGAYALFMAMNTLGVSAYTGILFSAGFAAVLAIAMAILLKGSRDAYFSIGIWVLADSLRLLFGQWEWVGSSRGIILDTSNIDVSSFGDTVFYMALALAVATHLGMYALIRARFGLGLMAIRDNETAAASVGIPASATKLTAFVASAVVCSLAGGIYYLSVLYVDPAGAFDIDWQIKILFIVIVGGVGTLEGPIIGTLIYFLLREMFRDAGDMFAIFQGVIAATIMFLAPSGIWGLVQARFGAQVFPTRWLSR
jgi:branched-chain amino acid transport system permease protein